MFCFCAPLSEEVCNNITENLVITPFPNQQKKVLETKTLIQENTIPQNINKTLCNNKSIFCIHIILSLIEEANIIPMS